MCLFFFLPIVLADTIYCCGRGTNITQPFLVDVVTPIEGTYDSHSFVGQEEPVVSALRQWWLLLSAASMYEAPTFYRKILREEKNEQISEVVGTVCKQRHIQKYIILIDVENAIENHVYKC